MEPIILSALEDANIILERADEETAIFCALDAEGLGKPYAVTAGGHAHTVPVLPGLAGKLMFPIVFGMFGTHMAEEHPEVKAVLIMRAPKESGRDELHVESVNLYAEEELAAAEAQMNPMAFGRYFDLTAGEIVTV